MQVEPRAYPGRDTPITTSYEELLSICLRNCANAFNPFALEGIQGQGAGVTTTGPSPERYALSVLDLSAHILKVHREPLVALEKEAWQAWHDKERKDSQLTRPFWELHHAIVELVEEKGLLAGKVRRSLVGA